ncbi:MAG: hypothetical protein FWE09_05830 [Treponema sp.]|nr:hypothetical protein [Treponema sp.]
MGAGKTLRFLFLAPISLALVACATSVSFNVERPPIVDLRGATSVTIVPLEQNSVARFRRISAHATGALEAGLRSAALRGNIDFVEPESIANTPRHELWRHVDVFLTGRIIDARPGATIREGSQTVAGATFVGLSVTLSVSVEIEYSYILAREGRTLGDFRKVEEVSETVFFARNRLGIWDWGNPAGWTRPGFRLGAHFGPWDNRMWFDPSAIDLNRRSFSFTANFPQSGSWGESLAMLAIDRFSLDMSRELAPWTTAERRSLRALPASEPAAREAMELARMGRQDEARRLYQEIFARTGNANAAFNTAVLFAAEGRFAQALDVLNDLSRALLAEGRAVPAFIRREAQRMSAIVAGLEALESARAPPGVQAQGAARAAEREISGTVNISGANVYALSDSVSGARDTAIWQRIVASAEARAGRWTMRIPEGAPSMLWFIVTDGPNNLFITRAPASVFGEVVLSTADMTRLE